MILLRDFKRVIITPERCASFALEHHFAHFGGKVYAYFGRHSAKIDALNAGAIDGWTKVIVVRNPYRRMESLYRLRCESLDLPAQTQEDWAAWLELAVKAVPTCHSRHQECPSASYVRLENLHEDLMSVGFTDAQARVPVFHQSNWHSCDCRPTETLHRWTQPDLWYDNYRP